MIKLIKAVSKSARVFGGNSKWLFFKPRQDPFANLHPLNSKLFALHMQAAAGGKGRWQ